MAELSARAVPRWSLGERLAKARKDAGLGQVEMAERLGVSRPALAQWEANRGRPRDLVNVTRRWAALTRVPLPWLLDIEDEYAPGDSNPEPADYVLIAA